MTEIAERLAQEIPEEAFYSDPAILLHEHSGQISPNVVTRVREIWNSYVHPDNEQFENLVGHLLTRNSEAEEENDDESGTEAMSAEQTKTPDETRKLLQNQLETADSWERNSFANLAFILPSRLADNENKPKAKMLKKIKATVSRGKDEDESTGTSEDSVESEQDAADTPPLHVTLYANGTAYACSESLATRLTGELQYSTNQLLDSCIDQQDCEVLQWLVENRLVQPVEHP